LYEPSLDWEDGHVAGVDYPTGDQYDEDEEKLQDILVDVAGARRLVVSYDQTDRANRKGQSVDQIRE
jgi:hypothetical protein